MRPSTPLSSPLSLSVSVLSLGASEITQLRTTTPLFKAYEEIYNNLEAMNPAFHKSEQVKGKEMESVEMQENRENT